MSKNAGLKTHKTFISYPLTSPGVQRLIWGAVKEGEPATLKNYFVNNAGQLQFGKKGSMGAAPSATGVIVELTDSDLELADFYQTDASQRITVTIDGVEVYCYVKA